MLALLLVAASSLPQIPFEKYQLANVNLHAYPSLFGVRNVPPGLWSYFVRPVAVIDTIGVDSGYSHRGVGHALLSQLFVNLGALRIERVETVVAPRDLALLGFLYDVGFAPSQRLPFVRRLA